MDHTVHGILQARILEWVAYPFSSGSSWPRNQTRVSCIAGGFFTNWAIREAKRPRKVLIQTRPHAYWNGILCFSFCKWFSEVILVCLKLLYVHCYSVKIIANPSWFGQIFYSYPNSCFPLISIHLNQTSRQWLAIAVTLQYQLQPGDPIAASVRSYGDLSFLFPPHSQQRRHEQRYPFTAQGHLIFVKRN